VFPIVHNFGGHVNKEFSLPLLFVWFTLATPEHKSTSEHLHGGVADIRIMLVTLKHINVFIRWTMMFRRHWNFPQPPSSAITSSGLSSFSIFPLKLVLMTTNANTTSRYHFKMFIQNQLNFNVATKLYVNVEMSQTET